MKINDVYHTKFKNRTLSIGNNHVYNYPQPAKPKTVKSIITDKEGLKRAYQQGDYFIHGDTMYVAGSHTGKDWYDDLTKIPDWKSINKFTGGQIPLANAMANIPFSSDLRNSTRYQKAEEALKRNPQVKKVVGHSLGGSVALELQKNYKNIEGTRTYGAPVFDPLGLDYKKYQASSKIFGPNEKMNNTKFGGFPARYRNIGDPFSIFDRSAQDYVYKNPFSSWSFTHDYSNIADKFTSEADIPESETNLAVQRNTGIKERRV